MTSPALAGYRLASQALQPLAGPVLRLRARAGKEDPARLGERLGLAAAARPPGPLFWLHGASLGESALALEMWGRLEAAGAGSALFTSGTRTSAAWLAARLPAGALHQFAPVDGPAFVRRFLRHWRPEVGLFFESELWPNLLCQARSAGVRLALLNARLSPRSLEGWGRAPRMAAALLQGFSYVQAADTATAAGLRRLGARLEDGEVGNLKLAASPPKLDPERLAEWQAQLGLRPMWVAASTHAGEEELALAAHAQVCAAEPEALLVLAPRHPERGARVAALAGQAPRRSLLQALSGPVYVADTIGELGLFYATARAALIGGSLTPAGRGHNPCEALALGCPILSGPAVSSFADVYAALDAAGGVHWTLGPTEIAQSVLGLLQSPPAASRAALEPVHEQAELLARRVAAQVLALTPAEAPHAPA